MPDPVTVFYHDVPDAKLAEEAAKHLYPIAYSSFCETTQHTPWETFPCTYIFTTEDRAIPFEMQQAMLAAMSVEERANWETVTVEGGHSPFLSKPEECAQVLRKIAGDVK